MKLQLKRMPAKKPSLQPKLNIDNTVVIDDHGGGQAMDYTISSSSGLDTITLDPVYTTTSASSITWNQDYNISSGVYSTPNTVKIDSNGIILESGTDITVGGKSLMNAIEKIEERLAVLHPNPELEDRWDQLKTLRQQYMDLEKELLEKEKMWHILKKS